MASDTYDRVQDWSEFIDRRCKHCGASLSREGCKRCAHELARLSSQFRAPPRDSEDSPAQTRERGADEPLAPGKR